MTTRELSLEDLDRRLEKIGLDLGKRLREIETALQDAEMLDEKIEATHMTPEQLAEFRRSRQANNPYIEEIRQAQRELKDMHGRLNPPPDKYDLLTTLQVQIQQLETAVVNLRSDVVKVADAAGVKL